MIVVTPTNPASAYRDMVEKEMSAALDTKVKIQNGKIVIAYKDEAELIRIANRLS